jgi:hypothetical protein
MADRPTEEMIERASAAYVDACAGEGAWLSRPHWSKVEIRRFMRAALTAALNPKPEMSK